jgi:Pyridoxamine 5'-phosphate oxidase
MSEGPDLDQTTRAIIDANRYHVLATADADGRPWATPTWFSHDAYTDFYWVSRPGTRHSLNIAARPEIALVIFNSTVRVGRAEAVYVEALAGEVPEAELESGMAIFSAKLVADGVSGWQVSDVVGSSSFRLYRARASAHFLLDPKDQRVPVQPKQS